MTQHSVSIALAAEPSDPHGAEFRGEVDDVLRAIREKGVDASFVETKMPSPAAGGGWDAWIQFAFSDVANLASILSLILQVWSMKGSKHQVVIYRETEKLVLSDEDVKRIAEELRKAIFERDGP